MRCKGTLSSWNDERGFGFITPHDGGKEVFLHVTEFRERHHRPALNQALTYTPSQDAQGRPRAVKASSARHDRIQNQRRSGIDLTFFVAVLYLCGLYLSVVQRNGSMFLFVLSACASGIAFFLYASDKAAAKQHLWRTPEARLHLVSLLGGWPGALVAQQVFRHKTKKLKFQAVFWVTAALNLAVVVCLLTPGGSVLRSWIGTW